MRAIDADELKTAFPCGEAVRTECVRATIDNMATIMSSVQPELKWIPCSERLPERGVSVLISHVGYVYEDYLDIDDGALFFWNSGLDLDEERQNIAWMPLPEPYKQV